MSCAYAESCAPHVSDNEQDKTKARWIISPPALYLLEQVFKIEHFPSLHMRQRLAADLNVSARQVRKQMTSLTSHAHTQWSLLVFPHAS